jgi:hypothetical protein
MPAIVLGIIDSNYIDIDGLIAHIICGIAIYATVCVIFAIVIEARNTITVSIISISCINSIRIISYISDISHVAISIINISIISIINSSTVRSISVTATASINISIISIISVGNVCIVFGGCRVSYVGNNGLNAGECSEGQIQHFTIAC